MIESLNYEETSRLSLGGGEEEQGQGGAGRGSGGAGGAFPGF